MLSAPLPGSRRDFDTNNPGKWISHCHNTYHLGAGMAFFVEFVS